MDILAVGFHTSKCWRISKRSRNSVNEVVFIFILIPEIYAIQHEMSENYIAPRYLINLLFEIQIPELEHSFDIISQWKSISEFIKTTVSELYRFQKVSQLYPIHLQFFDKKCLIPSYIVKSYIKYLTIITFRIVIVSFKLSINLKWLSEATQM